MGGRHDIGLPGSQKVLKDAIAQGPRRLFDSPATFGGESGDVTALGAERHVEPLRKFGHELRISIRLRTA